MPDMINHPGHYNRGKYEVISVIEDWALGFHLGNVVKYIARAKHKGNELEDLEKAMFYLRRYIELQKEHLCVKLTSAPVAVAEPTANIMAYKETTND